jgi:hypothetical protein
MQSRRSIVGLGASTLALALTGGLASRPRAAEPIGLKAGIADPVNTVLA